MRGAASVIARAREFAEQVRPTLAELAGMSARATALSWIVGGFRRSWTPSYRGPLLIHASQTLEPVTSSRT